jgi:hypothetical protein
VKEALVRNAADTEQVGKAVRKEKNKREQELVDFGMIMNTEHGRRFILRMLDITGFQKNSFTGNSTTFWNEGRRSVGLEIWADINEFPESYLLMITEGRKFDERL